MEIGQKNLDVGLEGLFGENPPAMSLVIAEGWQLGMHHSNGSCLESSGLLRGEKIVIMSISSCPSWPSSVGLIPGASSSISTSLFPIVAMPTDLQKLFF